MGGIDVVQLLREWVPMRWSFGGEEGARMTSGVDATPRGRASSYTAVSYTSSSAQGLISSKLVSHPLLTHSSNPILLSSSPATSGFLLARGGLSSSSEAPGGEMDADEGELLSPNTLLQASPTSTPSIVTLVSFVSAERQETVTRTWGIGNQNLRSTSGN